MSDSRLDQIVKGAPSRDPSPTPSISSIASPTALATPHVQSDPLSTLPSSPPQQYLNLLILEASLRSQFLEARARRRQHTFFLSVLGIWIAYFFYALFLRPREDGSGVGGSVYWVVDMSERLALMGGVVTGILVWGTGTWERGIRVPRKFVVTTNRGLRNINAKLVVIKGAWWQEAFSKLTMPFPIWSFFFPPGSSYHFVDHLVDRPGGKRGSSHDEELGLEEDLAPGGDYVKLLLFPKPFSPAFRENWEAFRTDYWELENERRATLLQKLRKHDRELAKQEGGWLWWTGWHGWQKRRKLSRKSSSDLQTQHHGHHHHHPQRLDVKAKHHNDKVRSGSHSRTSSRSTTPTFDGEEKMLTERTRRGSGNSDRKKAFKSGGGSVRLSRLTPAESRPTTPSEP